MDRTIKHGPVDLRSGGYRRLTSYAVAVVAALLLVVATAGSATSASINGIYRGSYGGCVQGRTGLTLSIIRKSPTRVIATFAFYADKSRPTVPTGLFDMVGTFDDKTRRIVLNADEGDWVARPSGYVTVDLRGTLSRDGKKIAGRVLGPGGCDTFSLVRR